MVTLCTKFQVLPKKKKPLLLRARYIVAPGFYETYRFNCGAEGETRTPTGKPLLDPEPSASTNSATSALNYIV